MASVILDFVPPAEPIFIKLHIFESATKAGAPGALLETVIFTAGQYPTRYTTNLATSNVNWFSIQWEDDKGGKSPVSDPVQGGASTVVSRLVDRVMLRDPFLNERVAMEIAEWIVSKVFKTQNPYDVDPTIVTYNQWEGMTILGLARGYVTTFVSVTSSSGYTAGLVQEKSGTGVKEQKDAIGLLLAEANKLLKWNFSYIMLLEDIDPLGIGGVSAIDYDQSRLLVTLLGID